MENTVLAWATTVSVWLLQIVTVVGDASGGLHDIVATVLLCHDRKWVAIVPPTWEPMGCISQQV